jgi:hypothetical protein
MGAIVHRLFDLNKKSSVSLIFVLQKLNNTNLGY